MARWREAGAPGLSVKLNVYDLNQQGNEFLSAIGLGLYHTGVEVGGREYSYGAGFGIGDHRPRSAQNAIFRASLPMGAVTDASAVARAVDGLRTRFPAAGYDLVARNCNHFSDALVHALVGRNVPAWVNRAALLGSCVACLVPRDRDPTQPGDEAAAPLVLTAPQPVAFSGRGERIGGGPPGPPGGQGSPTLSRAPATPPPPPRSLSGGGGPRLAVRSVETHAGKRALIRQAALRRFEASPD
mmetsp:Transcript_6664/g.20974  ORF Transcript_6664/g.20974 Transcript_6664/m.20974 type:complete len:242 (+) Transcript_6664:1065-1790(+)